jgi:hypothetical protein
LGTFLKNIPSLQDIFRGNYDSNLNMIIGIVGIAVIGYGLFLFLRDLYRGT